MSSQQGHMIYLSLFLFGVLFNRVRRVYLRFIVALSSHTMSYCFGWLDKNWLLKTAFMPPSKTNRTPNEDYQKRNFSVATFNALSLGTQQGYIGRNQLESLAFFCEQQNVSALAIQEHSVLFQNQNEIKELQCDKYCILATSADKVLNKYVHSQILGIQNFIKSY